MSEISPINLNVIQSQNNKINNTPQTISKNEIPNGKKKLALALAALAVAASAGIGIAYAVKRGIPMHELIKKYQLESNIITDKLQKNEFLSEKFSPEIFNAEKTNLFKSAKKAKTLEQAENILASSFEGAKKLVMMTENSQHFGEEITSKLTKNGLMTEELQKAFEEKNLLKAGDIFTNLKIKSKFFGETTEEILKNIQTKFSAFEGIKPHTYDKTKECDKLYTQLYYDWATGYSKDAVQNIQNETVPNGLKKGVESTRLARNTQTYTGTDKIFSIDFSSAGEETGKPYVRLGVELPWNDNASKSAKKNIIITSPTKDFTPVQKDLIEIAKRCTAEEKKYFAPLMADEKAFSYDAFLSVIQHLKNDAQFMAREIAE